MLEKRNVRGWALIGNVTIFASVLKKYLSIFPPTLPTARFCQDQLVLLALVR